ncbi:MAG: hypothetical protein K2Q07_01730 [Burkholderiaceae bacterium]|nr:hypothetical protein [Burkholderiaceae bacterium]
MNDRPAPDAPHADVDDRALRLQLRALTPSTAKADALADQVLAQWHELHREPAGAATRVGRSGAATLSGGHPARRWRWVGITTGLLIGAVIATVVWVQRPDPTLDELLQADVLSQMAIGEL